MYDLQLGWRFLKIDFKGHEIEVEVRPLKVKEVLVLSPFMATSEEQATAERMFKLVNAASPIAKDFIRDIKGLTVDSQPATPQMLFEELGLCELTFKILTSLFNMSSIKSDESKNSEGQSDT